jgi:hypothetical protein
MYTKCDKCGFVETTIGSINACCMHCKDGRMREVLKEL